MDLRSVLGGIALSVVACGHGSPPSSGGEAKSITTTNLAAGDLRKSGTVHLDITCKPEVRADFQTSLALLHSFFYEEARRRFTDLAARDRDCAMAHWGLAMTWYHPLWAPPTARELAEGKSAVREAKARLANASDLERGFVDAIDAFFRTDDEEPASTNVAQSCHGPRAHGARAEAFRAALDKLRMKYPKDIEVEIFDALALLATALPTDKKYEQQLAAAAMLEPLFVSHPDHPGVAHYLIHAYDYPELATRALPAARHYEAVAPWVPHALHMPSHIYTRLGMWNDSIDANRRSSQIAREYAARTFGGAAWSEDLHALDYLAFAYLQTARDEDAAAVVAHVKTLSKVYDPVFSAAYAIGAIPARYALERGQWREAADLPVLRPEVMKEFPFAFAHVEFAHAVGAARTGDVERARAAVARLAELRDSLQEPKFRWWIDQVEIQRLAGAGWTAQAEGKTDDAERDLRAASELEDRAGTHPVTPGQLLPAREQLGDLLTMRNRDADALAQYELALRSFPHRFNAHLGAARAAHKAKRDDVARAHYEQLLTIAKQATSRRAELDEARAFVARR
jgi:tetratricopeptide (TPR) repeat protein